MFGPHTGYILASYAAAGIILGALIVASLLANSSAKKRLAALEKRA
jgi:heme exporter protein CcmD